MLRSVMCLSSEMGTSNQRWEVITDNTASTKQNIDMTYTWVVECREVGWEGLCVCEEMRGASGSLRDFLTHLLIYFLLKILIHGIWGWTSMNITCTLMSLLHHVNFVTSDLIHSSVLVHPSVTIVSVAFIILRDFYILLFQYVLFLQCVLFNICYN